MPTEFLTQAQQAWEAADTLYKRSEGAERADARQFWFDQSEKKQSQAQALALLAIAVDLNRIASHLDALTSAGVDVDGATLEALRTLPLR